MEKFTYYMVQFFLLSIATVILISTLNYLRPNVDISTYIDPDSGCEYIVFQGITPKLDFEGKPICNVYNIEP